MPVGAVQGYVTSLDGTSIRLEASGCDEECGMVPENGDPL